MSSNTKAQIVYSTPRKNIVRSKMLLRADFKACLRPTNKKFREFFPEYKGLYQRVDAKKIKLGCCAGLPEPVYEMCMNLVAENPSKWREYYEVDEIHLYRGNPKKMEVYK